MGIKAFKKAGAIVLVLFPIFTWVITGHHVQRSVYPLCVMEEEGRKIAQDASLTATLLLDNEIGQFLVYSQSQEEYGTSNYATWVLCKKLKGIFCCRMLVCPGLFQLWYSKMIYTFLEYLQPSQP